MDEITTYTVAKTVQVYRVGNYEIESGYLWDALVELHDYEEDGRGSHRVEFGIYEALLSIGVIERRDYGKVAPTATFAAFYDRCEALVVGRDTPLPGYVWRVGETG